MKERALERIRVTSRSMEEYHRKIHKLRRLLLGDIDVLNDTSASSDDTVGITKQFDADHPDVLVKDVECGRSNRLIQIFRTLVNQVSYAFPDFDFDELYPEEAAVNSEYLRSRLGAPPFGCDAHKHVKKATYEMLVGGLGVLMTGIKDGLPTVTATDALRFKWDQTAMTVSQAKWASTTVTEGLGYWVELYGKSKFADYIDKNGDNYDVPIDVEYYYSTEGEKGHHIIFAKTGDSEISDTVIFDDVNPFYFQIHNKRVPFLPFEFMTFMQLPSSRFPISLAEDILPSQIALWNIEKTINETIAVGKGFWEYETGAYKKEDLEKFYEGDGGVALAREAGKQGMEQKPPMEIPQTILDWRQYNIQEVQAHGGANPFASGGTVEGTQYASEVHAIQSASSLMASVIAKEVSECWSRVARKVLAIGALYDDEPIEILMDGVRIEFDSSNPIRNYLTPEAMPIVQEDKTMHQDKATKLALAREDLNQAMALGNMFPAAMVKAYENYLVAGGHKDYKQWLEQPQQVLPLGGGDSQPAQPSQ